MKSKIVLLLSTLGLIFLAGMALWQLDRERRNNRAVYREAIYLINIEEYSKAAQHLRGIAEKHSDAAQLLGILYVTGRGVDASPMEALHYFDVADSMSAVKGDAAYGAGWELMNGAIGRAPDYREASYWFKESARAGHPQGVKLSELISFWQNRDRRGQ